MEKQKNDKRWWWENKAAWARKPRFKKWVTEIGGLGGGFDKNKGAVAKKGFGFREFN